MAKTVYRHASCRPDPEYPFHTEWSESGEIIYHVPFEIDCNEALMTLEARHNGGVKYIRCGREFILPVIFIRTTNRALAYDQRAWINTQHTQERRRRQRYYYFEGAQKNETGEELSRDENPLLKIDDEGFFLAESRDNIDRISEYIAKKHPDNPLYQQIFFLCAAEKTPKEIASILKIEQAMVYFYRKEVRKRAREYLQLS